ncbi:TetR/AcrR family transcriptional regulator [Acerihabitans sp.]|uniref:TetR/AcrR family transcriptional regulator n=1 Tax=Acerihabitans sp. TaxID=2811394 RepID=UPI002ED9F6D3
MPRVSRAETERNRIAIEEASSRLFREQGLRVSVADLMGAVGLTHGGFYGHFASKDDLAAIACAKAFGDSVGRWHKRMAGTRDHASAHAELIEGYLLSQNLSAVGTGCPLAALATDVSREPEDKPVRQAFLQGLEQLVAILAGELRDTDTVTARETALAEISTMVGALVLARATKGHDLSGEIMASAKRHLLADDLRAQASPNAMP